LNLIYLGSGAYGVGAAAKEYFDKDVSELTLAEASLLAGLPQAPSRYSPFRHWRRAKYRQRYVLERMARERMVTWAEAERALRERVVLADHGDRTPNYLAAPYFVEHVRRLLEERYGGTALHNAGLNVYTTVDLEAQRIAEESLRKSLREIDRGRTRARPLRRLSNREAERFLSEARNGKEGRPPVPGRAYRGLVLGKADGGGYRVQIDGYVGRLVAGETPLPPLVANDLVAVRRVPRTDDAVTLTLDTEPQIEGALVSLEVPSGHVKALVGGYDFRRSQFNRATQALRQPGSAFKPFIFAAALDRGYTTTSILVDAPVYLPGHHEVWAPGNYDNKFMGPITLRKALALSRNVVTVKLAQNVGLNYLVDYLPRFGFERGFEKNMAISLGASEVTPLELTRAYSVFANQGRRVDPIFIAKITDPHGNLLEDFEPESESMISPETAYLVTSMLKSVVERGTGKKVAALGRPTAGKTGTTNDFHDAWFIGYTPDVVTGVWVGYDSERSLGAKQTGGRVAAPIFLDYMQQVLGDSPVTDFKMPEGITCVPMDGSSTGRGADEVECFKEGTAPQTQYASDGMAGDDLDRAVGRMRFRHVARLEPEVEEEPAAPWPGGVEVIGPEDRALDWDRPRADDYLPPDDDKYGDERALDDDEYRANLRRRFQRELGDADYRPNDGGRRPGIVEESLP
jgi:penicillin-binding protein 1A